MVGKWQVNMPIKSTAALCSWNMENKNRKSLETREINIKITIKKMNPADFHGLWPWEEADCHGMTWRFVKPWVAWRQHQSTKETAASFLFRRIQEKANEIKNMSLRTRTCLGKVKENDVKFLFSIISPAAWWWWHPPGHPISTLSEGLNWLKHWNRNKNKGNLA